MSLSANLLSILYQVIFFNVTKTKEYFQQLKVLFCFISIIDGNYNITFSVLTKRPLIEV